jgi:hypothetical protein
MHVCAVSRPDHPGRRSILVAAVAMSQRADSRDFHGGARQTLTRRIYTRIKLLTPGTPT